MSRSRIKPMPRAIAAGSAAIVLGATLAGCSDIYFDHRDTISLSGGDAVAANKVEQTIDPWPPYSGNPNIAFNGERMQGAVERYRLNRVIQPTDPMQPSAVPVSQPQSVTQVSVAPPPAGTVSGSSSTNPALAGQ